MTAETDIISFNCTIDVTGHVKSNGATIKTNWSIVCLIRVWQPLFSLFWDKTFEFPIVFCICICMFNDCK